MTDATRQRPDLPGQSEPRGEPRGAEGLGRSASRGQAGAPFGRSLGGLVGALPLATLPSPARANGCLSLLEGFRGDCTDTGGGGVCDADSEPRKECSSFGVQGAAWAKAPRLGGRLVRAETSPV